MDEIKQIPATCEVCNKQFKNIFSLSAHSIHCKLKQAGKKTCQHFDGKRGWSKDKVLKPKEEIFVEGSTNSTSYVKSAIRVLKLKEQCCESCRVVDWLGKEIVLELHHINGDSNDNRLENLTLLCPNCHSQTPTFRGKNRTTGQKIVSDEDFLEALLKFKKVSKALRAVGLSGGDNYIRAYKLLAEHKKE